MKTKSLPWFRFYTEAADDPKVHRLSDSLYRFWINCLCLAGRHRGILPPIDDIAYHVRKPAAKTLAMRKELSTFGLLDELRPGEFTPHNWAIRQYEADVSTSRVKRFRERRKEPRETSNETDETVSETVSETDETVSETHGNGFMKRFPSVSVSVSDSVSSKKKSSLRKVPREITNAEILDFEANRPAPKPLSKTFPVWFARWTALTKRKQREQDAMRAWIGVVDEDEADLVMACLERYGRSDEVARGVVCNPDKWIYDQSQDGWAGDWPPARASPTWAQKPDRRPDPSQIL